MKTERNYILCLDSNCDGSKGGGIWGDKLQKLENSYAYLCLFCKELIPGRDMKTQIITIEE